MLFSAVVMALSSFSRINFFSGNCVKYAATNICSDTFRQNKINRIGLFYLSFVLFYKDKTLIYTVFKYKLEFRYYINSIVHV